MSNELFEKLKRRRGQQGEGEGEREDNCDVGTQPSHTHHLLMQTCLMWAHLQEGQSLNPHQNWMGRGRQMRKGYLWHPASLGHKVSAGTLYSGVYI